MVAPVPKVLSGQFYRISQESAFNAGGGTADWNIGGNGGGVTGWRDLAVIPNSVNLNPTQANIFMENATGKREMNQQAPVAGGRTNEGTLEMPFIPELMYPVLKNLFGGVTDTPTAGSAALASTAFASLATLDTQPDGTEVLKFVISSSTASSAAAINIIQNAATVETITIGTSASTVDGDYYSKGAYNGSVNAITFTVDGTVTSGNVVVSGIDYVTNVFEMANTNNSHQIEEAGQPRSASNSSFYKGVAFNELTLTYDRTAQDGLLMASVALNSLFPSSSTAGTYGNDAALYYYPFAGVTASWTKDGSAFDKVLSISLVISGGTTLFETSSGSQDQSGHSFGPQQVSGTITILPEDATEWNDFIATPPTVADYTLNFTSPNYIVDTTPWLVTLEMTKLYLETYDENTQNDLFGADLGIRTIDDATDGILKITQRSRMPL